VTLVSLAFAGDPRDRRAVLEGSEATREAADPSPASSPPERCWTVNIADGDQQEMAVERAL
jgi:hypothetical protein